MIRHLRRAACVLSLALWVATGLLAVRSSKYTDVAESRRVGRIYGARSDSGCLTAYATTYPPGEVTAANGFRWYQTETTGPAEGEPFYHGPGAQDSACAEAGIRRSEARVPYWFVTLCAACLPTWRLTAHLLSRRRVRRGRNGGFTIVGCQDLRASPGG